MASFADILSSFGPASTSAIGGTAGLFVSGSEKSVPLRIRTVASKVRLATRLGSCSAAPHTVQQHSPPSIPPIESPTHFQTYAALVGRVMQYVQCVLTVRVCVASASVQVFCDASFADTTETFAFISDEDVK